LDLKIGFERERGRRGFVSLFEREQRESKETETRVGVLD
jgi:hypothetical protein